MADDSPKRRSLLRTAGSWVGPLLLSLVLIEGVARIAGIEPLTTESIVWSHHDRWGWFHEPGSADTFVKPGFSSSVAINSKGLRERELEYEKAPGVFRVLVVGDSSVVSFEVPPEAVFLRVMEERLNAEGRNVEFVNGGVRGYGSDQALLFLEEEGLRYQPDLVLYKWTGNDQDDNATIHRPFRKFGKPWFHVDEQDRLILKGVPVPSYGYTENLRVGPDGGPKELAVSGRTATLLWLRDNVLCRSAFGTGLIKVALSLPNAQQTIVGLGSYDDSQDVKVEIDPRDRLLRTTIAIVKRMERSAAEAGADFQMIGVAGRFGKAVAAGAGLPLLGDAERFRALWPEDGTPVHMPFDPHLNELGHRLYAEAVAESVLAAGLLPPAGS